MTQELWAEIERQYNELADLSPDEQRLRLEGIEDEELRREVASLLQTGPLPTEVMGAIQEVGAAAAQPALQRFGPWRTTGVIGHGGMGAVYKAVRDDHAFDKLVAIKVLHLGIDSPAVRERFQQERGILAGLEHPNIARLLDGGETESGLSYIVLEYVDGESIVESCERRKLGREERIRLFLQICDAVQYAHQHLIIHRDLKPANILVTLEGVPKLLDFGIAKLMEPGTLQTMTGFQAMTPQYASPEQIRGQPVTTATDVYSLAMVLYEMLTGRRPYEVDTTSVAEIARTVCEVQPARPGLGGDLDNILFMALRKEAARRYATIQELAADLERYLSHRPVRARPDTLPYRAKKFLRRNRVALAAAVLLIGTLSGALAVTLRAQHRERARFDQVRQLATRFLFEFDRDIRLLPGSTPAREKLVTTAMQQLDNLSIDAAGDAQLTADLSQAYQSLADVLGMPGMPSLGHTARAEASYRKACALSKGLLDRDGSVGSPYRALACNTHIRLGYLLARSGRSDEARVLMLQGLSYIQPKLDSGQAVALDYRVAANGHTYLSSLEQFGFRIKSASQHDAQAVDLMRKYQELAPGVRARSDMARVLGQSGSTALSAGTLELALSRYEEDASARTAMLKENPNDVENRRELAFAYQMSGQIQCNPEGIGLGLEDAALANMSKALQLFRELVEADPKNASARHDLGLSLLPLAGLQERADPHAAESSLREGIRIFASLPPAFSARDRHLGLAWCELSSLLRKTNRLKEAQRALAEAQTFYAHDTPSDEMARGDFVTLWREQGQAALQAGEAEPAVTAYARIWKELAASRAAVKEDMFAAFSVATCAGGLAQAHALAGNAAEAEVWKAKSVELWQPWKGKYPHVDRLLEQ